jgi:hypothetical protein
MVDPTGHEKIREKTQLASVKPSARKQPVCWWEKEDVET